MTVERNESWCLERFEPLPSCYSMKTRGDCSHTHTLGQISNVRADEILLGRPQMHVVQ